MKFSNLFFLFFISIILSGCGACNTAGRMIDNGYNTIYDQFKPEELLRKYEWFKDAASQLEQKLATLKSYESRFEDLKKSYGADSLSRKKWDRSDKEQWNVWESEYLGLKASYNDLAAQYNAAMVKFNYAFCNVGQLPAGADMPLPRDFKPYINN